MLRQREFVFSPISYSVSHQLKMTLQESEPKIQSKFLGQKLKGSKLCALHLKILNELHKLLPQINGAAGNC